MFPFERRWYTLILYFHTINTVRAIPKRIALELLCKAADVLHSHFLNEIPQTFVVLYLGDRSALQKQIQRLLLIEE